MPALWTLPDLWSRRSIRAALSAIYAAACVDQWRLKRWFTSVAAATAIWCFGNGAKCDANPMKSQIILPDSLKPSALSDAQQDCLDKLQEVLEQAEAGNVYTVGIVVCLKSGFATTIGGTDAGSLNLGLDALKQRILARVTDEGVRQ